MNHERRSTNDAPKFMNEFRTGVIRPVQCLKEGWELIKDQYWLLFGITAVGFMLGGATMYILLGAMMCGIFYSYLRKIDGQPVQFDDLFKGMSFIGAGLLLVVIMIAPTFILMGFIYAPFIVAAVMGQNLSEEELISLLIAGAVVDVFLIILMSCFHSLLLFSFPLLVDRNLTAWEAVKLSARAVWANLGGVAGLFGVSFLLYFVGILCCIVGAYLTIPIILAGNAVAYRKIFPRDAFRGPGGYN